MEIVLLAAQRVLLKLGQRIIFYFNHYMGVSRHQLTAVLLQVGYPKYFQTTLLNLPRDQAIFLI